MKKVAIVVVLIILSITNVNAASKTTMKKYTRIYIATKYNWNNEEEQTIAPYKNNEQQDTKHYRESCNPVCPLLKNLVLTYFVVIYYIRQRF